MVAGKPAGGPSGHAGRDSAVVGHRHIVFTPHQIEVARPQEPKTNPPSAGICQLARDRIGEATGPLCLPGVRLGAAGESRSGWSSCLAVRTGRLRRSPAVHARPIDLVVFQEPMQLLLRETSSRRGLRA